MKSLYTTRYLLTLFFTLSFLYGAPTLSQNFTPKNLTGLNLWLRSDSLQLNGSAVTQWFDKSGNANSSAQATAANQPLLVNNTLGGHPVVRFDGSNDFMSGTGLFGGFSQFSFFTVIKASVFSNFRWIFHNSPSGTNASFSLVGTSSNNFRVYFSSTLNTNFTTTATTDKYYIISVIFDNTLPSNKARFFQNGLTAGTSNNAITTHSANGYTLGRRSDGSYYFNGDIAEIILYNTPLADTNRIKVEQYLRNRYSQPLSLGPDINVAYGFCDTTLDAGSRFTSFLWSTGATTQTISVQQPGMYWVNATDIFGYTSRDTIIVSYPSRLLNSNDTTICNGANIVLKPVLPFLKKYSFQWSDGSTDSTLHVTSSGNYWIKITDSLGCFVYSDTITVSIDNSLQNATLGPDTSFCAGNSAGWQISPLPQGQLLYSWSTGETTQTVSIPNSGAYYSTVTNAFGCSITDTINITITGIAPVAGFVSSDVCLATPPHFIDTSIAQLPDFVNDWFWDFGDGDTSGLQHPFHTYTSAGTYNVSLTATTNSGCSSVVSHSVVVHPLPSASFSASQACTSFPYSFSDNSSGNPGDPVVGWLWDFGDGDSSNVQNPFHQYSNAGSYAVELVVVSQKGCVSVFTDSIQVVNTALTPGIFSSILPQNNLQTLPGSVNFTWNLSQNADFFKLSITDDSLFISNIQDDYTQQQYFLKNIQQQGKYFWKVTAYNICGDSVSTNIQNFRIFTPASPGVTLWFAGDSASLSSNQIVTLFDMSGNNYHATQATSANRPVRIDSVLNGHAVARFDGTNDYLTGAASLGWLTRYALFFVVKSNEFSNFKFLYQNAPSGNTNSFGISAVAGDIYRFYSSSSSNANFSQTLSSSRYYIISVTNDNSLSQNKLRFYVNGQAAGSSNNLTSTHAAAGYMLGARSTSSYFFNGDLAEMIVFDSSYNTTTLPQTVQYLRHKYAGPPVSLGPDIHISYGFCDTTLNAGSRFTNFLWSTGDTTQTISVNSSGSYWVRATDIFGFFSYDTVNVSFPTSMLSISDTTICHGQYINLSATTPDQSGFTYLWSNGENTASVSTATQGAYWVRLTDAGGCSVWSDTVFVTVDTFALTASLGPDVSLCAGNSIGWQFNPPHPTGITYHWSGGSIDSTLSVSTSGDYYATVTNTIGCFRQDTINVNIIGIAPVVVFSADTVCHGAATSFTDLSLVTLPDFISDWQWNFGDTVISGIQHPVHIFTTPGIHYVTLGVTANSSCQNLATLPVFVKPRPVAGFVLPGACAGNAIHLTDLSQAGPGDSLSNWLWDFGDGGVSSLQNPAHTYVSDGFYDVSLVVTSAAQCSDTSVALLNVIASAPFPQAATLVYPLNQFTGDMSSQIFSWQSSANTDFYKLEIANDSLFAQIIFSQLTANTSVSSPPLGLQQYFWRVKSFNICNDSSTSVIFKFRNFSPYAYAGLSLWLTSDSVGLSGNQVNQWYDRSGKQNHALQNAASKRPVYVSDVLNGYPVIQFDGSDDAMEGLGLRSDMTKYSVFMVCKPTIYSSTRWLFHNAPAGTLNSFSLALVSGNLFKFYAGTIGINYTLASNPLNYYILCVRNDDALNPKGRMYLNGIAAGTSNYASATDTLKGYTLGSRSNASGFYAGSMAEVIVYDTLLSLQDQQNIEQYLFSKYAGPPVNLGPDITINYGFCDTTLFAGDRFTSYLWSTGDTSSSISVSLPGTYWVSVTNQFGISSSDTIQINRIVPDIADTVLCLNDTVIMFAQGSGIYTHIWSDLSTGSYFTVSQAGTYSITYSDTLGCIYTDFFTVAVDSFPVLASLGHDRKACQGDLLGLASGAMQTVSYQWSDGSGNSLLLINDPPGSTPLYSVTVTNNIGCVAEDSITLLINGVAPQPAFSADSVCEGLPTHFMDYSSVAPPYQIISWLWDFGDSSSSVAQLPLHTYSSYGTPLVSLTVTTDSGCVKTLSQPVLVWSKPQAWFLPSNGCVGAGVPFSDQTYSALGSVNSWSWDFGDPGSGGANTSTIQHPVHNYLQTGFYDVSIAVGTIGGCSDTLVRSIDIKDAPTPDFAYTNACLGEAVYFSDITQTQPWTQILEWKWHFGDGDSSTLVNPVHIFTQAGTFNVSLSVKSLNGCRVTVSKPVIVHAFPEAAFATSSICLQTPFTFTDQSTASTDTIISWFWRFGDGNSSSLASPTHIYQDTGMYMVSLNVSTPYGCADSVMQQVQVHPLPSALFSFSPEYGIPPQTVSFSNTSTGAQSYLWQFGDGQTSTESNPEHLYSLLGVYQAGLTATSSYGCSDTAFATIFMIPSSADIKIINAYAEIIGGFMELSADVINTGSRRADIINFTAQPEGGSVISERWTGALHPGESFNYKFQSRFGVPAGSSANFACITAYAEGIGEDVSPSDNTFCAVLNDELMIAGPDPNPGNGIFSFGVITPIAGQLEISLFNESGKEVMKLFSGISVKGFNRFDTDATQLGPGFYTLRVVFRDTALYRKLILY